MNLIKEGREDPRDRYGCQATGAETRSNFTIEFADAIFTYVVESH
jgi:hypothetical protein